MHLSKKASSVSDDCLELKSWTVGTLCGYSQELLVLSAAPGYHLAIEDLASPNDEEDQISTLSSSPPTSLEEA